MYLTGRQAAGVLAGAGLCRRQSRKVLDAGLAGEPLVTGAAHLYREDLVRDLATRPHVTRDQLDEVFRWPGAHGRAGGAAVKESTHPTPEENA